VSAEGSQIVVRAAIERAELTDALRGLASMSQADLEAAFAGL
jgi:hypothetical protein